MGIKVLISSVFLSTMALVSTSAIAGDYAQGLATCVYDHLTPNDKKLMTQWAFVTLGRTSAAKEVMVIPEDKIKSVSKNATNALKRVVLDECGKEFAQTALHEKGEGLKDATATLAYRIAMDELKGKLDNVFPDVMDKGTENVLKAGEVLEGLFRKRQ